MLVKILKPTDYNPGPNESPRCWGQLLVRPSRQEIEREIDVIAADGIKSKAKTTKTVCGPMVQYFPIGARPELPDDVAEALILAGAAEADEEQIQFVSRDVILDGYPAEVKS